MFRMNISESESAYQHEITIEGDRALVNRLRDVISPAAWVQRTQQYETTYANGERRESASFNIGLWNLRRTNNNKSVAQSILEFVTENNITLPPRTQYLLQYWKMEVDMISEQKSYRSRFPLNADLTSPKNLNRILNQCSPEAKLPSQQAIFELFENSKAMEGQKSYYQPLPPYEYEVTNFLKQQGCARKEVASDSACKAYAMYFYPREQNFWEKQVSRMREYTSVTPPSELLVKILGKKP